MQKLLKITLSCLVVASLASCTSNTDSQSSNKEKGVDPKFTVSEFDNYSVLIGYSVKAKISMDDAVKNNVIVNIASIDSDIVSVDKKSCTLTPNDRSCIITVTGLKVGKTNITLQSNKFNYTSKDLNITDNKQLSFQGFDDTHIYPGKSIAGYVGFPKGMSLYGDVVIKFRSSNQLVSFDFPNCHLSEKQPTCPVKIIAGEEDGPTTVFANADYGNYSAKMDVSISKLFPVYFINFDDHNIIAKTTRDIFVGFKDGTQLEKDVTITITTNNELIKLSQETCTLSTKSPNCRLTLTAGDKSGNTDISIEASNGEHTTAKAFINMINYFRYQDLQDDEKPCLKYDSSLKNLLITYAINNNGIGVRDIFKQIDGSCFATPSISDNGTYSKTPDGFYFLNGISDNNIIAGSMRLSADQYIVAYLNYPALDYKVIDSKKFEDKYGNGSKNIAISSNGLYVGYDNLTYTAEDLLYLTKINENFSSTDILSPITVPDGYKLADEYQKLLAYSSVANNGQHFAIATFLSDPEPAQLKVSAAKPKRLKGQLDNLYLCNTAECKVFSQEFGSSYNMSDSGQYIYGCRKHKPSPPNEFVSINPDTLVETVIDNGGQLCSSAFNSIIKVFDNGSVLFVSANDGAEYLYTPTNSKTGKATKVKDIINKMKINEIAWPNDNFSIFKASSDGRSFVLVNTGIGSSPEANDILEVTVTNNSTPLWDIK
jgi:hypothetical protein